MAIRKHKPGHNLGRWLHPAKGKKSMAMPPMSAAAASAPGAAGAAPTDDGSDDSSMGAGDSPGGDDGSSSENVLLTVLKNDDGTYTLIDGDEGDAQSGDMGSDGSESDASPGQEFDTKGALLKAILDILNEDESSEGADGSSDDQFQAGYDANAPQAPVTSMPQKY